MTPERQAAEQILRMIEDTFKPGNDYVQANQRDFRHLDLRFYSRTQAELEGLNYRFLNDVENVTLSAAPTNVLRRVMIRNLLSRDGSVMVGIYHPKLRFPYSVILWLLRQSCGKVVDFESELSDHHFLATTNAVAASVLESPPVIHTEYLPAATRVRELHMRHQERLVQYLAQHPGVTPQRNQSYEQVLSSQHRMEAIKAAYRGEIKGITKEELMRFLGPQALKEGVYQEVENVRQGKS